LLSPPTALRAVEVSEVAAGIKTVARAATLRASVRLLNDL
jgi:hypothetical protein